MPRSATALGGLQSERIDVDDEEQQAGKALSAESNAELGDLLDGVDGVAPVLARAMTLAPEGCACSRNEEKSWLFSGWLTLPRIRPPLALTTAVVSRFLAHGRTRSRRSGRTKCRRRPSPPIFRSSWRASRCRRSNARYWASIRPGEIGNRRAGDQEHFIFLAHHLVDRQRHAGIGHVEDGIDMIDVEPLPRDVGADVARRDGRH